VELFDPEIVLSASRLGVEPIRSWNCLEDENQKITGWTGASSLRVPAKKALLTSKTRKFLHSLEHYECHSPRDPEHFSSALKRKKLGLRLEHAPDP
jgi:hypothetical protein